MVDDKTRFEEAAHRLSEKLGLREPSRSGEAGCQGWYKTLQEETEQCPAISIWYDKWLGTSERHFWVGFSGSEETIRNLAGELKKTGQDIEFFETKDRHQPTIPSGITYEFSHGTGYLGVYDKSIEDATNFVLELSEGFRILEEQADIKALKTLLRRGEISATTCDQLIKARIGQGSFRRSLEEIWEGRCAVTGCEIKEMLRASHIKPWKTSNDYERLDSNNGLLLTANLDALFDKTLISFEDNGEIWISDRLSPAHRELLKLNGMKLRRVPSKEQSKFLSMHRAQLLKV